MKKSAIALAVVFLSSAAVAAPNCKNPLDCAPVLVVHDCPLSSPWSSDDERIAYCEISAVAPAIPGYGTESSTNVTPIPTPATHTYAPGIEPIINPLPPVVDPVVSAPPVVTDPAPMPVVSVVDGNTGVIVATPETIAAWEKANQDAAGTGTTGGTGSTPTSGSTAGLPTGSTTYYDPPTGSTGTDVLGSTTPGSTTTTTGSTTTTSGTAPDTETDSTGGAGGGTVAADGSSISTDGSTGLTVVTDPITTPPYITSVISMPVSNTSTGVASADKRYYFAQLSSTNSYVPPGPCNQYGCGGTVPLSYTTIGNDVVFFVPATTTAR